MRRPLYAAFATALLLLGMGNGVPDAAPPPITLDESAEKTVAKGNVHISTETWDSGAMTVGVVDVAASPEQTMDAVMDMHARVDDIGSLKSALVYLDDESVSPQRVGVEWALTVFGTNIVFSVLYKLDRETGFCRYTLDTDRENGIDATEGAYQVYAHNGGTRLVYRGFSDSGRYVPGWVKRWLAGNALVDQMTGMKQRAEASAGG